LAQHGTNHFADDLGILNNQNNFILPTFIRRIHNPSGVSPMQSDNVIPQDRIDPGRNTPRDYIARCRPETVALRSSGRLPRRDSGWLRPQLVRLLTRLGNAGRHIVTGAPLRWTTLSAQKNFRFGWRGQLLTGHATTASFGGQPVMNLALMVLF
jgi:hypothetical protein